MVKTTLKRISDLKDQAVVWARAHQGEFILLLIVLSVASFMRLYRISDYMTFLGDEGRDVIIVRRFITEAHPMLIGPGTSIGNMYLGPLYYYMMAPALLLANFSPVGPAVMVALLGIVTVFMIWYIAREWFGREAAFISSLLYAIAPTVIVYSRSSWNPNIMPFFALIAVYCIWRVWRFNQVRLIPIVSIAFAACLQSHYLALLLAPTLGLFLFVRFVMNVRNKTSNKPLIIQSLIGLFCFIVLMSPLVIFDARHGWRNFSALKIFFTERQTTVSIKPWNSLPAAWPQLTKISTRLVSGYDASVGKWVAFGLVATASLFITKKKFFTSNESKWALLVLFVWFGTSILGLGLYKQEIYDHYYGLFFPAPFMIIGGFLGIIAHRFKIRGRWLAGTALVFLVWVNLSNSPLKAAPNSQLARSVAVTDFIREKSNNEPFNFAVIAERNYEGAYRYFFNRHYDRVVDIDPQNTKDTITNQLFVVCEMEYKKCDPTHNAKAEVANFGWTEIVEEWQVSGTTVFKLGHVYPTETKKQ